MTGHPRYGAPDHPIGEALEREIGVYWYLFSNHYSLRCIYVERKQRKRAQLLLGVLELYKSSLLLAFSCFAR